MQPMSTIVTPRGGVGFVGPPAHRFFRNPPAHHQPTGELQPPEIDDKTLKSHQFVKLKYIWCFHINN